MPSLYEVLGSRGGDWIGADNVFIALDGASYYDIYGDVFDTLYGNAQGGDDTITGGEDIFRTLAWGDALSMRDNALGGDDVITGSNGGWENTIYGDARGLYGNARGGDDVIRGGNSNFNTLYGDGGSLSDYAVGGDDLVIGGAVTNYSLLFGDADTLTDNAIGGNDTLVGGGTETNFGSSVLMGDAEMMTDNARGGDDVLISGTDDDRLWGDAVYMEDSAVGGADTFIFNADSGKDTIGDFEPGKDRIDVSSLGLLAFPEHLPIDRIPDHALARIAAHHPRMRFTLDSNGDGVIDTADENVRLANQKHDLRIDLGAAAGGVPGQDVLTVADVTDIDVEDFVFWSWIF